MKIKASFFKRMSLLAALSVLLSAILFGGAYLGNPAPAAFANYPPPDRVETSVVIDGQTCSRVTITAYGGKGTITEVGIENPSPGPPGQVMESDEEYHVGDVYDGFFEHPQVTIQTVCSATSGSETPPEAPDTGDLNFFIERHCGWTNGATGRVNVDNNSLFENGHGWTYWFYDHKLYYTGAHHPLGSYIIVSWQTEDQDWDCLAIFGCQITNEFVANYNDRTIFWSGFMDPIPWGYDAHYRHDSWTVTCY
jgi:hypothetical protein